MPIPRTPTGSPSSESELQSAALRRLRQGSNPFALQVAAIATEEESLQAGVPEFATNQLAELLEIVGTYRGESRPATRVYTLLGERGSGKTHMFYALRAELRQRAIQSGDETMVVVVDRLSAGMEPVDYLLWQIVNHLLAQKGDGERLLGVAAGRLTARLLAEALRRLAPPLRAELIPPKNWWDRLCLRMGSAARTRKRQESIDQVIAKCDGRSPTPEELRQVCKKARLPVTNAIKAIEQYLERSESNDVHGWFRKQLYSRLAKVALLEDREPFEELHAGDYEKTPAYVKNAGNLSHRLLEIWLELLLTLNIPVVVIFDQLEDYLRSADPEQENVNRRFFTGAASMFINQLKHICILVFVEFGFWNDLLNRAEAFASERLSQPFALPGRPAKKYISMPETVPLDVITRLIQQRIRKNFPDLDLTGLPPTFPFGEGDLKQVQSEQSIRRLLRRLAKRYDEIVYVSPPPKADLRQKLAELWKESVAAAEKEHGSEMNFKVAFIPEIQNALQGWLECMEKNALTGANPSWQRAELLTDPTKQMYGNLCVIRTAGLHAPGVGIAAWLGTRRAQSADLKQRVGFFDMNPCPIRTLVMLRADGEDALVGETKAVFDKAIKGKRDIRIQRYEPKDLHSIMAFGGWHQAASAEVEAAKESDPEAERIFRQYLGDLSTNLLGWIDTWRRPAPPANNGVC